MYREKIIVATFSLINLILFTHIIFYLGLPSSDLGFSLMLFPVSVGLITYIILTKAKKFNPLRALKYTNIAFFAACVIPVGIFIAYFYNAEPMYATRTGRPFNPVIEKCIDTCSTLFTDNPNTTSECIMKCVRK